MPKITLNLVKGSSYYCSGRLSIGVHVSKNKKATLIDSGIDTDTAKSIDTAIKNAGFQVSHIINTHSHADHCGGNKYFQDKYKELKIYSTKFERHYIEDPAQEPTCFCSGAAPFAELRNKHLEAQPSIVTNLIHPYLDQPITIDEEIFTITTLPGHTPGMIGIITPDNVLYCGDAIFGAETLNKHGVLFYTNIKDTLASFKKLSMMTNTIDACVFYHGGKADQSLDKIAHAHTEKVLNTCNIIYDELNANHHSLDTLTQFTMKKFGIPENVMQFTLTRTCVQAYVTYLQQEKKINLTMQNALMTISSVHHSMPNPSIIISSPAIKDELKPVKEFETQETADLYILTFKLNDNQKVTGAMHADAHILNSVEFLVSGLKIKNLIKNQPTQICGIYDTKLGYNSRFYGEFDLKEKPTQDELSSIKIHDNKYEFNFEKSKMASKTMENIKFELSTLGISSIEQQIKIQSRF